MIPRSVLSPLLAALALALPQAAGAAPGLDLGQYRGKVVYLDFWASWCAPCRQSFPWMQDVQSRFGRDGFAVVAVNVDHDHAAAERFLEERGNGLNIVFDPKGDIASKYKVSAMPMSVLIGRDGRVRFNHLGFYEKKEGDYVSQIEQLVSEKAP